MPTNAQNTGPDPLCAVGKDLYLAWSKLLDQKHPRAERKVIAKAKNMYDEHRRWCKDCPELIDKVEQ